MTCKKLKEEKRRNETVEKRYDATLLCRKVCPVVVYSKVLF